MIPSRSSGQALTILGLVIIAGVLEKIISYFHNRWLQRTYEKQAFQAEYQTRYLPNRLITNLFGILGALSKADGRVSEEEIRHVDQYMQLQLQLENKQRRIAIAAFREGVAKQDFLVRAKKLHRYLQKDNFAMLLALQMVQEISLSGGIIAPREQQMIVEICQIWGIAIPNQQQAADINQQIPGDEGQQSVPPKSPPDPFSYFGCTSQSTSKELKNNYRALCKKYHPDTLRSKSFHPNYLKHAEDVFKEIQVHWKEVCELRTDL